MNATLPTTSPFGAAQFRMSKLQVFNWGTFSGLHTIPIAERGFLFVGRSGAGKSTLLDGFAALLVPPKWIDFNAAARDVERSGRDRNLVTYIRGAWAEQKDSGSQEILTRYLRPNTTWSALALSYCNGQNETVVLVQLFWLRGSTNGNTDVKRHYLIFDRSFDLSELANFDLDIRKLKQSFPDAFMRDEFRPYCERFCRLLGIESELALRLLHKTQSAKSLGDLNTFLRDFMLDKPVTFEVADRLVDEFSELHAAHQAVVTARQQVDTLLPARQKHEKIQLIQQESIAREQLRLGIDNYREMSRMTLLEAHIEKLHVKIQGLDGEILRHEASVMNQKQTLRDLEQQHYALGGDKIEQWEFEKTGLISLRDERLRKRSQVQLASEKLGWILSDSPQDFATLTSRARQEINDWQEQSALLRNEQVELAGQKRETEKEFTTIVKEVESLKRQSSNIPANMLDLRRSIAQAMGLSESALPFVGELIEVCPEHSQWQGAIERLLHGFALSLLVEERYYHSLSNHINAVNLGGRLIYFRTESQASLPTKPITMHSLIRKLKIKENHHTTWLETEIKNRFDYACVDSLQAFRQVERALTLEGQMRHGKARHEKDDRYQINDRRHWVLGFDNQEKRLLFEKQAQSLAEMINQLAKEIESISQKENQKATRAMHCQTLANTQWQEIEVASLLDRIKSIEEQLNHARKGNRALQEMNQRICEQTEKIKHAEEKLRDLKVKLQSILNEREEKQKKLLALQQDPLIETLTQPQRLGLAARFANLNQSLTLDNLDNLATRVERSLNDELKNLLNEHNQLEKAIEGAFADFKRHWPMEASDMDTSLRSAPDFFAKLQRLETDGLPAHEERFFELLQNQSHQNLAALSTHLNQARKAIFERMTMVNESLSQAQFNPGTYLHIDARDKQLPEVREFKQEIQQALSHAWTVDKAQAEHRFIILQHLVNRLASQESAERRWRETVLDVRQHVEFIGRELDLAGNEVEIYRSGVGKSGGQRQKLATTCLAAALRYQLGSNDNGVPLYAPVILDEAFDKADNEFTALAMNIFANFGFQMIVATPLRSVMTLEPFIGGACFVEISDRRHSGVLLIEYDSTQNRLKLPEIARHDNAASALS